MVFITSWFHHELYNFMPGYSRRIEPRSHLRAAFVGWTAFERVWLLLFCSTAVYVFLAMGGTTLELVASITGMITVVLVAKGRISNYYFGLVNTVLYAYLAYGSGFYGEVMLNVGYYVPIQLVGLYLWSATPLADTVDTVRVRSLTWVQRALVVTGAVAVIGGYALVLDALGGTLPLFDSASTVLSIVAMALLVVRATEQWVFWITVNVLSIYMWSGIYLADGVGLAMVVMWTAYLVNSVYGLYNWTRLADGQQTPEPAVR